jgi:hypothetical protein
MAAPRRLDVMVPLTEGLPVGLIPEQRVVALVVALVVDDVGRSDSVLAGAVNTERVASKEFKALLAPASMAV